MTKFPLTVRQVVVAATSPQGGRHEHTQREGRRGRAVPTAPGGDHRPARRPGRARHGHHAAGPQGHEGLALILRTIEEDLGPVTVEQHHLVGEGDLVAQHLTMHGVHRASSMPLLAGVPATGRPMSWTFIHLWRVADGMIVEHWACRDDLGLLEQLRDGSAAR